MSERERRERRNSGRALRENLEGEFRGEFSRRIFEVKFRGEVPRRISEAKFRGSSKWEFTGDREGRKEEREREGRGVGTTKVCLTLLQ